MKDFLSDVTVDVPRRVDKFDLEVLEYLKENPIATRNEIAKKVGKAQRTVQRAFDRLKEAGKIIRIGNNVTGYWKVIE